jgi:hypothetical protein
MHGTQTDPALPYSNAPQFGPHVVHVPEPLTMQEASDLLAIAAAARENEGLAALLRAAFADGA